MEALTLGDIMNRLNNDLFPSPTSELEKHCRDRELRLKEYMNVCGEIVNQHIRYRKDNPGKIGFWKENKIKENIIGLGRYTELMAIELDKERIEAHCSHSKKLLFSTFEPDVIFIIFHSLHGSILSDVLWAGDMTIIEAMEMSAGKLDLNSLGKYLPSKLASVEKDIIPYLKESNYSGHSTALKEVISCHENKLPMACNLLLMTTIEGLVRDLAKRIAIAQKLDEDIDKYHSLDKLLREVKWKDDFEMSSTEVDTINQSREPFINNYAHPNIDRGLRLISDSTHVNLKVRLNFLRRRFKEDRDMILHGQNVDYGSDWNLFVNFSALGQVHQVLKYYDKLY